MPTSPGVAQQSASTFRMECSVWIPIEASPGRVWALLTDAAGFRRWNSTVTRIDGPIELGRKLSLTVPISDRTFAPRVTAFEPERRMVWADGFAPMFKGVRTFTLTSSGDRTEFSMIEVFSGLMLPLIKGSLPDFAPSFEQYARDLKQEAERSS